MPYLDAYTTPLSENAAAHLLRRVTFGPTRKEISDFTGKTAAEAVSILMNNVSYGLTPSPPVELDETKPNPGQPFINLPYNHERSFWFGRYIKCWWIGLMTDQKNPPSVLEKLSLFWQNHFVTRLVTVEDYRYSYRYLNLIRSRALGNFGTLIAEITKDPAMLIFQNGNVNQKGKPNENYARELQEIFVVGEKDFNGNPNYTEDDVKAAARALTGWECRNHATPGTTEIGSFFTAERHDTENKKFSNYYGNTTITGKSGSNAGSEELTELISMLLKHPHTPKFICRKLYRWYVNTNVTREIEDNVITPLATFFSSSTNNYAIQPVLEKLLTSQIFFDELNRGVIVKSPADLVIGTMRYFNQPVPDINTDYIAYRKYTEFEYASMADMQMDMLDQPTVFGFTPYYQTGYSKNWISTSTLAIRSYYTNCFVYRGIYFRPDYLLGLDLLKMASDMQPGFSDVDNNPSLSRLQVLDNFTKNFFATDLAQQHKDYIVNHIMMTDQSEEDWTFVWNLYRRDTTNDFVRNGVRWRLELLMRYVLRMGEYNVF